MTVTRHSLALIAGAFALMSAGAAQSQDFLGQGKTPAQIYASDCAICHKSPRGLSGAGGLLGLERFLREHYTASRELASALANYLRLVDRGPGPEERRRAVRPKPAPAGKDQPDEKKPASMGADSKPADAEKKPAEAADPKPADEKGAAARAAAPPSGGDAKPAEAKPETRPAESKPPQ